MKQVLTIGGATYDTIINYGEQETLNLQSQRGTNAYLLLEEGKKIEVTDLQSGTGGGATNSAVAFTRLGFAADTFCKVGQDLLGEKIVEDLESYGVNTRYIRKTPDYPTASSFIIPSLKGDRTVFAHRGANTAICQSELPDSAITDADMLYITSLSGKSSEQLPEITKLAVDHGVPVAINPGISQLKGGCAFIARSLDNIDMLMMNSVEAKQLMASLLREALGKKIDTSPNLAQDENKYPELLFQAIHHEEQSFSLYEFFHRVLDLGPKVVVVTHGGEGVYVATKDGVYFHQALGNQVINTLGAGDAFSSTFVAAMLDEQPITEAIRWGVANSASVVSYNDAKSGLLDKAQVIANAAEIPREYLQRLPLTIE